MSICHYECQFVHKIRLAHNLNISKSKADAKAEAIKIN